ncbi:MAG: pyruvate synthase [Geobacteraceae bacterium]|nr:pyruvate synthase [Geobacteraceae bacterium]
MMHKKLLTGNSAAAWGARLAGAEYVPAFPITPQTEIIETLAYWIDTGEMDCRMTTLESEHSMITAAGAAAATGVRVFTATSSQGLLYSMEMLYTVAGWRAPFVMANVSRGLSSPITLEPDHNDILAARDSGFLQIHCSTCQEVLDSILIAYRLAEHERVRLPVIVNMDGFYLSFTREPVELPALEDMQKFLLGYDAENIRFSAGAPISEGVAVLGGTLYSYFRYEMHLAALNGLAAYNEIADEFAVITGRQYRAVEGYRSDDAELVFVMMGSFATKAKAAVDQLREAGMSVGLVRPVLLRPFPRDLLRSMLTGKKGVAVVDQNLSMGMGGILYAEIISSLNGLEASPPIFVSFIGGLGGRDIGAEEFYEMANVTAQAVREGHAPAPRLLLTCEELAEVKKLQEIAGALGNSGAKS